MAWDHLSITKSHLVYIILGGFTSLFMLCSSVIKERMYIGEATVATLCGVIFGPHAANLIDPKTWGNVDEVTLEFSRIVLVVQCFAVGVELPKFYMERHWRSVILLLIPVMTFGWLITSLFVWWMVPPLNWLESLTVAACVTATDPVLASSVVGKGKFAKRVPKHLRDLLSAESGCNDGMAFPFIYLAIYLIQENLDAKQTIYHWLVYTVLYECIFGAIYGFLIGYVARHGIKFAEKNDLIDRESFLVFYFTLALFCAGSGSILGVDDLLVGFAAGVGFSNDGWFSSKTEESHVSNVIDLLLNLAYFVYLGTIIPWEQYNNVAMGLSVWKLVIIAIFVILFRRIPVMLMLKPLIPDVKTWREALFAGHFGPIGVGAIFVAILARAELESGRTIPLDELPPEGTEHYTLITLVWPIVTFLVISSILVHGSSVAVFTLGKHINTLTLTMSYTQAPDDGPSWMNRLPRISSQSRSQARTMSDTDVDDPKLPQMPPGTLLPTGLPGQFLRRQHEEENASRANSRSSSLAGRRRKKWDAGIGPGGPVSQSAIFPQRSQSGGPLERIPQPEAGDQQAPESRNTSGTIADGDSDQLRERDSVKVGDSTPEEVDGPRNKTRDGQPPGIELYDEGGHIIVENEDGQVLAVEETHIHQSATNELEKLKDEVKSEIQKSGWTVHSIKNSLSKWRDEEVQKRKTQETTDRKHAPARAYQFGNTIIVEDEDGEVVKKYDLPPDEAGSEGHLMASGMKMLGMGGLKKPKDSGEPIKVGPSNTVASSSRATVKSTFSGWGGLNKTGAGDRKKNVAAVQEDDEEKDDRQIRFTIGGVGQRLNKDDFLKEVQKMDARTRREALEHSDASPAVISVAKSQLPSSQTTPTGASRPAAVKMASDSTRTESKPPARPQPAPALRPAPTGRGRSGTKTLATPDVSSDLTGLASSDTPETAVERRRRLAALSGTRDEDSRGHNEPETPAERRRREAALGARDDSDSEDDDTPRVPPARRGIRFADIASPRGRS